MKVNGNHAEVYTCKPWASSKEDWDRVRGPTGNRKDRHNRGSRIMREAEICLTCGREACRRGKCEKVGQRWK